MKILMAETVEYNSSVYVGSHHYADFLAKKNNDILWLSNPISLLHWANIINIKETINKFNIWLKGGVRSSNNILTYSPFTLIPYKDYPILKLNWIVKSNLRLTLPPLKSILKKTGFLEVDILWITNPMLFSLLNLVKYKTSVYRAADVCSLMPGIPKYFIEFEKKLIKSVDKIFVSAEKMKEIFAPLREDMVYLPNGCSYHDFADFTGEKPIEYRTSHQPKVVYIGTISHWFDFNLLEQLAKKLPDVSFLLAGPVKVKYPRTIKRFKNIHFLGPKPYKTINAYLYHADCAFMPFKKNQRTDIGIFIKVYDSLAAGTPIVSTNLNDLANSGAPVYLARNVQEFAEKIRIAIREKSARKEEFQTFARNNSWESRFKIIEKHLDIVS